MLGKTAADLQENVAISGREITGTLKLVTDYTGFSSATDEQSGNYLALHVTQEPEDATVTVELDDDGLIVLKIADTAKQSVKVTVTNGEDTATKTYSLKGLTLATE